MAISLSESLHIGIADIAMRKVRSVVTILGIVLGVMSIMVVLAILGGMNQSTLTWMQERGGLNKVVIQQNWRYDFSRGGEAQLNLTELEQLRSQMPSVKAFNPIVSTWIPDIRYREKRYQAQVMGVYPDMQIVDSWYPQKGRFISELDLRENSNVIVLGSSIAKELFGSRNPVGQKLMLKGQMLEVIGVLSEKYWENPGGGGMWGKNALEYMNRQCFIPLSTMVYKVWPGAKVVQVEITAFSPEEAIGLRKDLQSVITKIKGGKKLFTVSSAKEELDRMQQNTKVFSAVFIMIAAISLLVGGIVIMNIMLASIKERTREIGVRLAIGARPLDIFLQFVIQTVLITTLGGVFGIALGYLILDMVGGYLEMQMVAGLGMIYTALLVSVGIGLIFGIAPAMRAARLDPVVALREE